VIGSEASTIAQTPNAKSARIIAWCVAIALVLFLCAWPLIGGMAAANDDLKFFRSAEFAGTLWQDVREGWSHHPNFRPLENIAALLCDEHTLECRGVMLIQIGGLLALLAGLAVVVRRLFPSHPIALPMLIIWLTMSPATTISLWQMDTCSQTWTAALAAWTGVIVLGGIDATRAGRGVWTHVVILTLLCATAVNIKEMFYGWSAGIGFALIVAIAWLWQRERPAALRAMWMLVPVAVLPAVHLLVRLKWSGLGMTVAEAAGDGGEAARYQINLGSNLLRNAGLSILGLFADGPLHVVTNVDAPLPLRLAPLAALVASFIILAAAGLLALLHRQHNLSGSRRARLLAAAAGLTSVAITLPMGSVSELYGFGANVASGLIIVASILALWSPVNIDERTMCRAIVIPCAAALLAIGLAGVASRAYHFRLTWLYARELNRIVLEHQRSLPPRAPGEPRARIIFERPCYAGQMHSQYIISPVQAIGITDTMHWMNRRDPERPVVFEPERTVGGLHPNDLVIQCETLPPRRAW